MAHEALRFGGVNPASPPKGPRLSDLLSPSIDTQLNGDSSIPAAFLRAEAVDASIIIGQGASFTVTRQTLPAPPPESVFVKDMGGWTIGQPLKHPNRPKHIVYKSADVTFAKDGTAATPRDRQALQSVITELHCLVNSSFRSHPNIIKFLGLAWGRDQRQSIHRLPVLIVEYGDLGTLADVQHNKPPLSDQLKRKICLGIADGLQSLHNHGVIHGDVKPENVIMCSSPQHTMIPKIADFGFAIITHVESDQICLSGTRTWRAPETVNPLSMVDLEKTDIYSFGLVAWSILIDGQSPFDLMLRDDEFDEDRATAIDRLKAQDLVLSESWLNKWVWQWRVAEVRKAILPLSDAANRQDHARALKIRQIGSDGPELDETRHVLMSPDSRRDILIEIRKRELFRVIEIVFENSLQLDPARRSWTAILQSLANEDRESSQDCNPQACVSEQATTTRPPGELQPTNSPDIVQKDQTGPEEGVTVAYHDSITRRITNTSDKPISIGWFPRPQLAISTVHPPSSGEESTSSAASWKNAGFKRYFTSWQTMRDLQPSLQNALVKNMTDSVPGPTYFTLSACHINGFGISADVDSGLAIMSIGAKNGSAIAQAYLYRFHRTFQVALHSDTDPLLLLRFHAMRGSRIALMDLATLDPYEGKDMRRRLRCVHGGVGSDWYSHQNMLHGLSQPTLRGPNFDVNSLDLGCPVDEVVVNRRGDRLIHAAAAFEALDLLQVLLRDCKVPVNQLNAQGETALLCACRSGHTHLAKVLLDYGADASLQASNGESPLHWLVAFEPPVSIDLLGGDLIRRGRANVHASTLSRVSHGVFPASIETEFRLQGTPLMWAVHDNKPEVVTFLLSAGAHVDLRYMDKGLTPLQWAARFHHHECLKLMVEHNEAKFSNPKGSNKMVDRRFPVMYGPLVRHAIHAADKFSMVMRNGDQYLHRLRCTFQFLKESTENVNFVLDQKKETPIHMAARQGNDEACEAILELQWRMGDINKPGSLDDMTPLLQSVRWNRLGTYRLLRNHGAASDALAFSPFDGGSKCWSALHVFAEEGHNQDFALVDELVNDGVSIDGDPIHDIESPLQIAVRNNAFLLADHLIKLGATLTKSSSRSSLISTTHPLTSLGHIIALNGRHSSASLRYLIQQHAKATLEVETERYIVEPQRKLTALHLCAMVPEGLKHVGSQNFLTIADFDGEINRSICHTLLETLQDTDHLNTTCDIGGKTALHLAVEHSKIAIVEELIRAGADPQKKCAAGETVEAFARRLFQQDTEMLRLMLEWIE